ncbi:DNA mismatch repair protein MutL [Epithele typhae]|uniref:DNA mismatch repair protein MutL n=1 Tax=Epithele typhae TaxID=378194 RepID=UPI0020085EA4|nr:DNA mismatch repair protein MutL [Epithele typhae]KAH9926661.1 DNA mismatch repair protein MutL [Epithele typhae]
MSGDDQAPSNDAQQAIKALDGGSIHKITSGQVVVDIQTAVKELVENSLDAGATSIEVRFKEYGLDSFEVIDNGSGIRSDDHESIALKHHTSKLASFTDLESVATFGFRGEALSSLCALADAVSVTTATAADVPVGTVLEFERSGKLKDKKGRAARQRGTTVVVAGLFKPLPVRRKELERNAKREYAKALALLHSYALVPCAKENAGVRLTVTNTVNGYVKSAQLRTDGSASRRASVSSIWGPKTLESLVDLNLTFDVEPEAAMLRRLGKSADEENANQVHVRGLISKFVVGSGRTGTDRQFFFVNGRPCAPSKVQKAFNEVYRTFNATQSPFVIADFILPANSLDINVSPDKRTILLHSENNLVQALKNTLEETYALARATFDVSASQALPITQAPRKPEPTSQTQAPTDKTPLFLPVDTTDPPASSPARPAGPHVKEEDEEASIAFGEPTLLLSEAEETSTTGRASSVRGGVGVGGVSVRRNSELESAENGVGGPEEGPGDLRGCSDKNSLRGPAEADEETEEDEAPVGAKTKTRGKSRPTSVVPAAKKATLPAPTPKSGTMRPLSRDSDLDDEPVPAVRRPAVARSAQVSGAGGEQMVLSTMGTSWSLRRRSDELVAERPRKKTKLGGEGGREARLGLRSTLRDYAALGSQPRVEDVEMEEGEEEEEEAGEEHTEEEDTRGQEAESPHEEPQSLGLSPEDDDVGSEPLEDIVGEPPDTEPSEFDEPMEQDGPPGAEDIVTHSENEADENVRPTHSNITQNHPRPAFSGIDDEVVRTDDRQDMTLTFNAARVVDLWNTLQARLADAAYGGMATAADGDGEGGAAGPVADDDEATQTLSRVIDKADFAEMEIAGQFNLGFVIVRRRKPRTPDDDSSATDVGMDDLFIVDQHAADEKYNFETLQRTTKIDSQKLFAPQVLELTAADEVVALENIDVLRQNGFELDVSEDRPAGQRMHLTAQPMSKGTTFDMKDLEELLHLMHDRPAGQMVRCSKARAMFAMRACRKSVMIGTALSRRQMTSVVQHMGTMDQPWHCPHGRPTMRHLSDIRGLGWDRRAPSGRTVDWAAFGRTLAAASDA